MTRPCVAMAQAASCQWTAGPPTAAMSCPPCERRGLQQPQQDGSVLERLPRAGAVTRQGKTKRQDRATRKDCGKTKNLSLECRSLSTSCGLRNLCVCCCLCNFVFVSLGFVGVLKLMNFLITNRTIPGAGPLGQAEVELSQEGFFWDAKDVGHRTVSESSMERTRPAGALGAAGRAGSWLRCYKSARGVATPPLRATVYNFHRCTTMIKPH